MLQDSLRIERREHFMDTISQRLQRCGSNVTSHLFRIAGAEMRPGLRVRGSGFRQSLSHELI